MADNEIGNLIINIGAEVAQLRSDMGQAVGILKSSQSTLSKVAGGIGLGIGAAIAGAAIEAIRGLPAALSNAIHEGEALGSIRDSFEAIGGSSIALENAKQATLGLVDSFDLMKIANEGLIRGIPDLNNQFGALADYAARLADATGQDTKAAVEGLVNAIAAGQPKMLAAQGIIIDTEKAYRDYAAANNLVADSLTKLQQKEAIQLAAQEKVRDRLKELPPITESAANAFDALVNSIGEITAEFKIAINDNEELKQAFNDVGTALKNIDWAGAINSISTLVSLGSKLASVFIDLGGRVLGGLTDAFNGLVTAARAAGYALAQAVADESGPAGLFSGAGNDIVDQLDAQKKKLQELASVKKEVADVGKSLSGSFDQKALAEIAPHIEHLKEQTDKLGISSGGLAKDIALVNLRYLQQLKDLPEVESANDRIARLSTHAGDASDAAGKKMEAAAKKAAAEAKKAADEVARLGEKWNEAFRSLSEELLDEEIDLEIKNIELGGVAKDLDKLIEEKAKLTGEKLEPELREAVEKGVLTKEQADKYKEIMISRAIKPIADARYEAEKKVTDKIAEEYEKKMKDAVDGIHSALGDLFSDLGLDSGFGKAFDLIFEKFEKQIGDLLDTIASKLGTTGETLGAGIAAGINVLGGALSAKGIDKANKSNKGTGAAVGGGIGAIAGGIIGGPVGIAIGNALGSAVGGAIGDLFKWGSQNPETQARHFFANWLEDQFKKLGEVSFTDAQGKVKTFMGDQLNFVEGATDRFNKAGWGDKFKEWGANATQVFKGLGQALEETLGLTEEVGDQIGFLLGENLSGNVDNARMLVQQLGLNMDDLINKLVEAGVRGEMSWLEVTSSIAGVQEAFKPGLVAAGAFASAFDNIISSGGKGYDAIKAVKDIAVEAGEAGFKSLDQLKQALLAAGKDPKYVESLFAGLQQAGITSIQAITEASTQTLGAVIASMEASNQGLADSWNKMREEIEGVGDAIAALPDSKHILLEATSKIDKGAQDILDKLGPGGKPVEPTEPGPTNAGEGTRSFRKLSTSGANYQGGNLPRRLETMSTGKVVQFNIDARNSSPGVEADIMRALADVEDRVISRTLEFVASQN
jgi:hypothetical protein